MKSNQPQSVKLMVRGEGANDYGVLDMATGQVVQEGCYVAFVRAVATGRVLQCVNAGRFPKKLPGGAKRRAPKLRGFERHSFYSTLEALERGADWLVIGTDTDRGKGRRRRKLPEACREKYEQLRHGHKKAVLLRPEAAKVGLVCLVPLVKLESWLLADEEAFQKVTGFARGDLPGRPERLYGQTDAKKVLDMMFHGRGQTPPGTGTKSDLAAAARPPVLSRECPVSYPPFAAHVRALCR